MSDEELIHREFARWASANGAPRSGRAPAQAGDATAPRKGGGIGPGEPLEPILLDRESAARLVVIAAKLAAGFFQPTRRTVVVWVEGDSELAVEIGAVRIDIDEGRVDITLPVRCDQSGPSEVVVTFAVGEASRPAGVYGSTLRRPTGPQLVVDVWGEALVAFAWKVLLMLAAQLAGATGKDARGNVLVPAELSASKAGLTILPMGRFRFDAPIVR